MNKNGGGNCKKVMKKFKYKPYCYVLQPSSCDDLYNSTTDPGKQYSAKACKGKGDTGNFIDYRKAVQGHIKKFKPTTKSKILPEILELIHLNVFSGRRLFMR